jgi:multiple sugar transport system permease protein
VTTATLRAGAPARGSVLRKPALVPTVVLVIGALYCLLPVVWVIFAATKTRSELFSTFTLAPSFHGGFAQNLRGLFAYHSGRFWSWVLNSLLYAGVGSILCVGVSGLAGYGLAKFRFPGRSLMFSTLLAGVLIPGITLAIPQYLLLAKAGFAGTYWSVLLPNVISPYGIYLCRIYATAAVSDEMIEAGRIDGAGEFRIFRSIAAPVMLPGLITVLLLQFVAIWNNFLLPYIMLSDDKKYPLTVGLFSMLNNGVNQPALYSYVIMGALLSILPLVALFLFLQRFWRMDLLSGGVKG